jgi:hypothetical protein
MWKQPIIIRVFVDCLKCARYSIDWKDALLSYTEMSNADCSIKMVKCVVCIIILPEIAEMVNLDAELTFILWVISI